MQLGGVLGCELATKTGKRTRALRAFVHYIADSNERPSMMHSSSKRKQLAPSSSVTFDLLGILMTCTDPRIG